MLWSVWKYFCNIYTAISYGGGVTLTVSGTGFDPESAEITVCNETCIIINRTSSEILCDAPNVPSEYEWLKSVKLINYFNYSSSLITIVNITRLFGTTEEFVRRKYRRKSVKISLSCQIWAIEISLHWPDGFRKTFLLLSNESLAFR